MKTIGIIGLGLIGGSIARALKEKMPDTLIIAYNRTSEILVKALSDGIIDHYTKKINESFSACDIIFICVPVNETFILAEQLKKYTSKDTIVTDAGSTKYDLCDKMRAFENNFTFIGGHPMAGSEQSGYAASKHYLFENAYYLLTPYEDTSPKKLAELTDFVRVLGALPLTIDPATHDFIVGAISHVPHVIAMSLVNAVEAACRDKEYKEAALALASGGFKDITRIASSSPIMWNDISIQNSKNILDILSLFKGIVNDYECRLTDNNKEVIRLFESAKSFRDEFMATRRPSNTDMISIDIEDKPGGISFITTVLSYNNINIKNIGISNSRDSGGILEIILDNAADKAKSVDLLRNNGLIVHE